MLLTGESTSYGPITLNLAAQSGGFVLEPITNAILADGYFDMFIELNLNQFGVSMHNGVASRVFARDLAMWPAVGTVFESIGPTYWLDQNGQPNGFLSPEFKLTMTSVVPVPPAFVLLLSCVAGLVLRGRSGLATHFRLT